MRTCGANPLACVLVAALVAPARGDGGGIGSCPNCGGDSTPRPSTAAPTTYGSAPYAPAHPEREAGGGSPAEGETRPLHRLRMCTAAMLMRELLLRADADSDRHISQAEMVSAALKLDPPCELTPTMWTIVQNEFHGGEDTPEGIPLAEMSKGVRMLAATVQGVPGEVSDAAYTVTALLADGCRATFAVRQQRATQCIERWDEGRDVTVDLLSFCDAHGGEDSNDPAQLPPVTAPPSPPPLISSPAAEANLPKDQPLLAGSDSKLEVHGSVEQKGDGFHFNPGLYTTISVLLVGDIAGTEAVKTGEIDGNVDLLVEEVKLIAGQVPSAGTCGTVDLKLVRGRISYPVSGWVTLADISRRLWYTRQQNGQAFPQTVPGETHAPMTCPLPGDQPKLFQHGKPFTIADKPKPKKKKKKKKKTAPKLAVGVTTGGNALRTKPARAENGLVATRERPLAGHWAGRRGVDFVPTTCVGSDGVSLPDEEAVRWLPLAAQHIYDIGRDLMRLSGSPETTHIRKPPIDAAPDAQPGSLQTRQWARRTLSGLAEQLGKDCSSAFGRVVRMEKEARGAKWKRMAQVLSHARMLLHPVDLSSAAEECTPIPTQLQAITPPPSGVRGETGWAAAAAPSFSSSGFARPALNTVWTRDMTRKMNGQPAFWSESGEYIMYWCDAALPFQGIRAADGSAAAHERISGAYVIAHTSWISKNGGLWDGPGLGPCYSIAYTMDHYASGGWYERVADLPMEYFIEDEPGDCRPPLQRLTSLFECMQASKEFNMASLGTDVRVAADHAQPPSGTVGCTIWTPAGANQGGMWWSSGSPRPGAEKYPPTAFPIRQPASTVGYRAVCKSRMSTVSRNPDAPPPPATPPLHMPCDSFTLSGFSHEQLNRQYSLNASKSTAGRSTFWDDKYEHYVYWCAKLGMWRIGLARDFSKNLHPDDPGSATSQQMCLAAAGSVGHSLVDATRWLEFTKKWEFVDGVRCVCAHWRPSNVTIVNATGVSAPPRPRQPSHGRPQSHSASDSESRRRQPGATHSRAARHRQDPTGKRPTEKRRQRNQPVDPRGSNSSDDVYTRANVGVRSLVFMFSTVPPSGMPEPTAEDYLFGLGPFALALVIFVPAALLCIFVNAAWDLVDWCQGGDGAGALSSCDSQSASTAERSPRRKVRAKDRKKAAAFASSTAAVATAAVYAVRQRLQILQRQQQQQQEALRRQQQEQELQHQQEQQRERQRQQQQQELQQRELRRQEEERARKEREERDAELAAEPLGGEGAPGEQAAALDALDQLAQARREERRAASEAALRAEVQKLVQRAEEAEGQLGALKTACGREASCHEQLKAELRCSERKRQETAAELQETRDKLAEVSQRQEEAERRWADESQKESDRRKELAAREADLAQLRRQHEIVTQEYQRARDQLQHRLPRQQELEQGAREASKQFETAQLELAQVREELSEVRVRLEQSEAEGREQQPKAEAALADLRDRDSALRVANAQRASLEKQVRAGNAATDRVEQELARVRKELQEAQGKAEEATRRERATHDEASKLRQALDVSIGQVEELSNKCQAYEERNRARAFGDGLLSGHAARADAAAAFPSGGASSSRADRGGVLRPPVSPPASPAPPPAPGDWDFADGAPPATTVNEAVTAAVRHGSDADPWSHWAGGGRKAPVGGWHRRADSPGAAAVADWGLLPAGLLQDDDPAANGPPPARRPQQGVAWT